MKFNAAVLRARMGELNWRVGKMAKKSGVTRQHLSAIYNSNVEPSLKLVNKMAKIVAINPMQFYKEEEKENVK